MLIGGDALERVLSSPAAPPPDAMQTVGRILARRRAFGITRLGSVTELDRIGIPVAQAVRPLSRSVSVNQGKGLSYPQAAISALMESLEGWASERIPAERVQIAPLGAMDPDGLWTHLLADAGKILAWVQGWDLFSSRAVQVPLGLVDTAYTLPSPHPGWMVRNTTGLAASTSWHGALTHACLETLERDARCAAMAMPHFFDRFQVEGHSVTTGTSGGIVGRLLAAGCELGIWSIPTAHDLPVYWCHVMEGAHLPPLAPWPAEGFGCDLSHDRALAKALLEACQSRLGVISAAREDVTATSYAYQDVAQLSDWRRQLAMPAPAWRPVDSDPGGDVLPRLAGALRRAGAKALIVVPLHQDETIPLHVLRVLTPPLATDPEFRRGA